MKTPLINNRYEIIELIAEGGMGKVFHAKDTLLNREDIALKTIKDSGDQKSLEQALIGEFHTLFSLSHPNLLKVFDIGRDIKNGNLFLINELIIGDPLDEWIKSNDFFEFIRILYNVLSALSYLHRNNMIHGDLKPAHFIIDSKNKVKIIDFGLVKHLERSYSNKVAGSIRYLAPEIFQGKNYSKQSDIYALGVSIYFSIFKKFPFKANTVREYIFSAINDVPRFDGSSNGIPETFLHILKKALHPSLSVRYADADHILSDLCEAFDLKYKPSIVSPAIFSPFIDRSIELGELMENIHNRLNNIDTGQNVFINLYGREGVGKRRLLRQFKVNCKDKGLDYFSTKYIPGMEKHLSVMRMLIPYIYIYAKNAGIHVSEFINSLDIFINEIEARKGAENPKKKNIDYIYAGIDLIMKLSAKVSPIIIIIEEIEKLDEASMEFLKLLIDSIDNQSAQNDILLIISSIEIMNDFYSGHFKAIELKYFDKTVSRQFLKEILGDIPISESFSDIVYKTTGGNPAKVEKLLLALFYNDYIKYRDGIYFISGITDDLIYNMQDRDNIQDFNLEIINNFTKTQRLIIGFLLFSYKPMDLDDISDLINIHALDAGMDFVYFLQQMKILQDSIENIRRTLVIMDREFYDTALKSYSKKEKRHIHSCLYDYFIKKERFKTDYCLICYHLYHSGKDNILLSEYIRYSIEQISKENILSYENLFFINIALKIKNIINDEKYIAEIIQEKIRILFFLNDRNEIDKIKEKYLNEDTAKKEPLIFASVLKSILDTYNIDYDNQSIMKYLELTSQIQSFDKDIIDILEGIKWNTVYLYLNMNKHDSALKLCSEIFENFGNDEGDLKLSNYYGMLGEVYNYSGNFKSSFEYRKLALDYALKTKIINQIAISEHNLAIAYFNLKDFDKALEYLKKAYEKFNQLRNYMLTGYTLNNIVEVLIHYKNDIKSALAYALNAFEVNKIVGGINLINNYKSLSNVYKKLFKYEISLHYLQKGIEYAEKNKRMFPLVELYLFYCDLNIELADYKTAMESVKKARIISKEFLNNQLIKDLLLKDFIIAYLTEDLIGINSVMKKLKKYSSIKEAFFFLLYYSKTKDMQMLKESYDYIKNKYNPDSVLNDDHQFFLKSSILYYKDDPKKLSDYIHQYFDFLQNTINGSFQDFSELFEISKNLTENGIQDIRKKAYESIKFTIEASPEQYRENLMKIQKQFLGRIS